MVQMKTWGSLLIELKLTLEKRKVLLKVASCAFHRSSGMCGMKETKGCSKRNLQQKKEECKTIIADVSLKLQEIEVRLKSKLITDILDTWDHDFL